MDPQARAYDDPKDVVPTLAARVAQLEAALTEMAETVENHGNAIARVGSRLARAENHVGLPGSDV